MYTKSHQSHQVATGSQTGAANLVCSTKASSTTYVAVAIAENPRNVLTNSIEQLFYNGSVSAPFDFRVLQYACFQCKKRLLKHISNLNSRYTNPNLVHELCTPCKYVFLSISQKSNQKLKHPQQSPDSCLINLDSNPLQSTLLKDVFFSVPSPEKCETDDLDIMRYDSTSRWTDTSSPTLSPTDSPTDFLIDEGENLFGFDLDPDFSSDQSTFGSSDTESSETASVHSQMVSASVQKDDFELASLPSSPAATVDIESDLLGHSTEKKRSLSQMVSDINNDSSVSTDIQNPTKLVKLAHPCSEYSTENTLVPLVGLCQENGSSDDDSRVLKNDEQGDVEVEGIDTPVEVAPRITSSPTIFETLSESHIDWCRYCGTTEGVNWRPGPWGKRTLCNKHGCDYKGYGFACKLPRLNLTAYVNESIDERTRPVLQHFCTVCQKQESHVGNILVMCEGCPKAFHQQCFPSGISDEIATGCDIWFCDDSCADNLKRRRIVVELPRKRLPLMCNPKSTPEYTKQRPTSRSELSRKPPTRKTTRSPTSYESKTYSKRNSKSPPAVKSTGILSDEELCCNTSPSRRVVPRTGGKNLSHYTLTNRTMNYYESSSDSSEDA